MKPVIIIAIAFVFLFATPVFALEYYEHELHEFSFNSPSTWDYEENVRLYEDLPLFQVRFYVPSDIIVTDDYPQIGEMYEFISSLSVSTLNERTVEDYVSEQIISSIPDGRLTFLDVESKSWGWVVTTEFFSNIPDRAFTIFYEMKSYFFKNGDLYNLEYSAGERYFDTYYPEFETVLDSLVIKGIEVNKLKIIPAIVPSSDGGGCLIATATYGTELAPQVQQLRELRDNSLLSTESGTNFMNSFNDVYYSFSPIIADYERENPVFKEMVKIVITPMISSLSILNYVDMDSEIEVLGYGISLIVFNVGMYVGVPIFAIMRLRK